MDLDPRVRRVEERFDELAQLRAGFDTNWQIVSELMLPSRTFNLTRTQGELRTRFIRNPIGMICVKRLAALLFGYMLSPTEPWVGPRLLARDPRSDEQSWFERVEVLMHERLSGPTSSIATNLFETMLDNVALGTSVTARLSKPRRLPRIQSVPLAQAYVGENGEGEVDTVARKFTRTAGQAVDRWAHPQLVEHAKKDRRQPCTFVHLVEPRPDGIKGARRDRKPFASTLVWLDKRVVLEEEGFDRLPFQVGRFERQSGDVYGVGPGWNAYPAVFTANAMSEAVVRAAELRVDPPLMGDMNLFGGRLDRRPGAVNNVNLASLMLQGMKEPVMPLSIAGDVPIGVEMLARQDRLVQSAFYLDWLALNEGPAMTATEVNDRRDQRLRFLAPMVARLEQEQLNPLVEDFFFAMLAGGYLPPPPPTLAGEEIGFVYRSPLALAQRGQHVEAYGRAIQFAQAAMAIDPAAGKVLRMDEVTRKAARLIGITEKELTPPEELADLKAEEAARVKAAEDMAATQVGAAALQQGAQGLASLAQAEAV